MRTHLPQIGTLLGLANACTAAWATGREMAGIALAMQLFPFMAAFAVVAIVLAVYLFLQPRLFIRTRDDGEPAFEQICGRATSP
jgi:hypothetical protein